MSPNVMVIYDLWASAFDLDESESLPGIKMLHQKCVIRTLLMGHWASTANGQGAADPYTPKPLTEMITFIFINFNFFMGDGQHWHLLSILNSFQSK